MGRPEDSADASGAWTREQASEFARAQIAWGHDPRRVMDRLIEEKLHPSVAREIVQQYEREQQGHLRRRGARDLLLAPAAGIPGVLLLTLIAGRSSASSARGQGFMLALGVAGVAAALFLVIRGVDRVLRGKD